MTKKIVSWLSFMTVFLFLYSCRQELLSAEDSQPVSHAKTEWISKSQIEQNPNLSGKLQSLSKKDPKSGAEKIYTDQENGFTIDTERALMMQDEKGKKTYTFKIDRQTGGVLENLVLAESGNGYLDASIIKYAPELFNSKGKLTNEQVKQYITIDYLGKKSSSEIFAKIQTCYATVQQQMYVPATTCASSDHHQYGDPACTLSGWQAATPGYWTTGYTFMMYSCDDGMPDGGFGTTPIGGGGGGGGLFIDVTDPCNILKSNLQLAKQFINRQDVKNQNDIMTQTIVTDAYEKAFYFGKDLAGNNKISPIVGGTSNSVPLNLSNTPFLPYAVIHNHNGTVDTGYTNFSSADLNSLNDFIHQASTTQYLYANGYDGSMYVMTIQDMDAFDQFVEKYPWSSIDVASPSNPNGTGDWKKNLDIYNEEINTYRYFLKQNKSDNEAYDLTMAYLANKYNNVNSTINN
ncbi:hypothetical protein [uncultured Chryseobacterium sp.]|uniref:hypothetical protein n=1 Tax=uncultured Chryseobacterium sp. TaxID=259322 RepID=UPI0025E68655|nr:hypothetical protein [uncultured Chryseobacterium sp.]